MHFLQRVVFIALLCSAVLTANDILKKVTLQLSWFDQFQFAGYYIAKEKGFYKELGLDVTIIPFQFGLDIPSDVSSGKIDFAIGRETLILERSQNKKIVALYALFQASPLVLISTKESKINTLNDFVGKRIMTTIGDASEVSLKAMIASRNINMKDLTFLDHTHNIQDLVDKKTDIISAYISKAPYDLEKQGIEYNIFDPKYYGFDMYSDFLFTNENLIANDIKTVNAFKEASLKGWGYAYQNIEESAELIVKKYNDQHLSKEALVYEGEALKKLSFYTTAMLGKIEKSKMQRIYDLYNVMGLIENKIDIDDFMVQDLFLLTAEEEKYLKNKKELRVCSDPNWMPLEAIKDGKLTGISADYLSMLKSKIHIPVVLVSTSSWDESIAYIKNRKCDILSLAMETPERKKYMNFTVPYLSVPMVIATTNDKFFIAGFKDILAEKIGIVKGFAFVELLKLEYPNIHLIEVANIKEGLNQVASGKLFGFIDTVATIGYEMQKDFMGTLKIAGRMDKSLELGFGVRNDELVLLDILNRFSGSIDEKTKQKILGQWVSVKYEKGFDYTFFWKFLVGVALLLIIITVRFRVIQNYNKKINKNLEIINKYVLLSSTNIHGVITEVSDALCVLSGYTKNELIGKSHTIFRHPDMDKKVFVELWKTIKCGKSWSEEIKNLKKDGSTYWLDTMISPIFDKYNKIEGYRAFHYDITDKKRIEALSVTDQLTQISNRHYLDTHYKAEIQRAKRYHNIFSIIMLDIDFFKTVNDTSGHTIGDKVLIEIANILKENIRYTDLLGRWGGEEFLIICAQTNSAEAVALAEKLRIKIENFNFDTVGHKTCSFGVSEYRPSDKDDDVIQRADRALYRVKENGRNAVAES